MTDDNIGAVFSFKGRYDDQDEQRNLFWPEDVYAYRKSEGHKFVVGYQIFNLSYMEAFHPLDIVNARFYDTSVINADKLGELSLGVEKYILEGDLKLYLLPKATRPLYPGKDSRLQSEFKQSKVKWIGLGGEVPEWSPNFLISFEKSYDNFDAQFVLLKNIDRKRMTVGTTDFQTIAGNTIPTATAEYGIYFAQQFVAGAGIVYNFDEFQLKGTFANHSYPGSPEVLTTEGIFTPASYNEGVIGFELPVNHENGYDSTFILEYQKILPEENENGDTLQNDVFLAWKLNFNDPAGSEINTSLAYDVSGSEEGFFQAYFSRRYKADFKYKLGLVHYLNTDGFIPPLDQLEETNHIYANITYFY